MNFSSKWLKLILATPLFKKRKEAKTQLPGFIPSFYGSIYGVDWGEMDPGAKWSFWVIFAFLEEIEQLIIVQ